MGLTDIVEQGRLTLQKVDGKFVIEYAGYNEYGTIKSRTFESRSLRLAYLQLEEYLKYGTK